jgi:hypothetical protein
MSLLPDIFGSSSGDESQDEVERDVNSAIGDLRDTVEEGEKKLERRRLMSGEDLDLTDEDVDISVDEWESQINVVRSAVEEKCEQAVEDLEMERRNIENSDVSGEAREVLQETEQLEEVNEQLVELVREIFEVKAGIGDDTSPRDIAEIHMEAENLLKSNMQLYDQLRSQMERHPELRHYIYTALNVYRNLTKIFSAIDQDAQREYSKYRKWVGKKGESDLKALLPE